LCHTSACPGFEKFLGPPLLVGDHTYKHGT
jgi:hypothetical protein